MGGTSVSNSDTKNVPFHELSELIGPDLDLEVAKTLRLETVYDPFDFIKEDYPGGYWVWNVETVDPNNLGARTMTHIGTGYSPSTKWEQAGPIIQREEIGIAFNGSLWCALKENSGIIKAESPLVAAMRCFIISTKLPRRSMLDLYLTPQS
jgi:hypothetical protein